MPPNDRLTPSPSPDEALLRRFIAGDDSACRTIEAWARRIVRFRPYRIPGDHWDDIVQEALSGLWRACARPGFTLRIGLEPLVRRIVMARCIDWLRRRRPLVELDETLPDRGPMPDETAAAASELDRVRGSIARLGEGCRDLIRMHFTEDLTYAEIAARTGRTEGALRVRMFQCMEQVRRMLIGPRLPQEK